MSCEVMYDCRCFCFRAGKYHSLSLVVHLHMGFYQHYESDSVTDGGEDTYARRTSDDIDLTKGSGQGVAPSYSYPRGNVVK
jgi:hypothetical protein